MAVLALVSFSTGAVLESRAAGGVEEQIAALYREAFPDGPMPDNPVAAMREAVRDAEERAEFLGVYRGNLSALDVFTEISKRVPEGPRRGSSRSSRSTSRRSACASTRRASRRPIGSAAELAKFGPFEQAQIGAIETDTRTGGKKFNVTISLASDAAAREAAPEREAAARARRPRPRPPRSRPRRTAGRAGAARQRRRPVSELWNRLLNAFNGLEARERLLVSIVGRAGRRSRCSTWPWSARSCARRDRGEERLATADQRARGDAAAAPRLRRRPGPARRRRAADPARRAQQAAHHARIARAAGVGEGGVDGAAGSPAHPKYRETKVEVGLRNATLAQTVHYLHQIDIAPQALSVKSLRIRTRAEQPDLLDVTFTVSSFEPI